MKQNFFFENFFRRKCSLGSCATFSENMVSVSVLGFENFASQVWKIGTCHEICEKKLHHMGISQSLYPQKTKKSHFCRPIHKIRQPRSCIRMFYNYFAEHAISYGLSIYGAAAKSNFSKWYCAKNLQARFFFKQVFNPWTQILREIKISTIFELNNMGGVAQVVAQTFETAV